MINIEIKRKGEVVKMRFIMTLVWSFLLVTLVNYVAGAVANVPFQIEAGMLISVVFALLVVIVGETLTEPKNNRETAQ